MSRYIQKNFIASFKFCVCQVSSQQIAVLYLEKNYDGDNFTPSYYEVKINRWD